MEEEGGGGGALRVETGATEEEVAEHVVTALGI